MTQKLPRLRYKFERKSYPLGYLWRWEVRRDGSKQLVAAGEWYDTQREAERQFSMIRYLFEELDILYEEQRNRQPCPTCGATYKERRVLDPS